MIDAVYNYLIGRTSSILTGYSESFNTDSDMPCIVYRLTGGTTSKTLKKTRQYTSYTFNALVRGGQDSKELVDLCDLAVLALDLDQTVAIMCTVTSEPQYAYTDENGNMSYTFNISVIV